MTVTADRAGRIERAVALRAAGRSRREIAAACGVTKTQVARDLADFDYAQMADDGGLSCVSAEGDVVVSVMFGRLVELESALHGLGVAVTVGQLMEACGVARLMPVRLRPETARQLAGDDGS